MKNLITKEIEAIQFLKKNATEKTFVSFSGGKDSLVALDLAIRANFNEAIFCDTTIEFDETLQYVNIISNFYGIKIDIVKAPIDFFEIVRKIGFPSRRSRWCCDVFKFGPLSCYAIKNKVKCFITGLRSDESIKRKSYNMIDKNPLVPVTQLNPLLDWTEEEIWAYIKKYNLPINPLYNDFIRLGCWCCPFKRAEEYKKIESLYPDLFYKLKSELKLYAEKIGITNLNEFIENYGWTSYISPIERVQAGFSIINEDENEYQISFIKENQTNDLIGLIPILTNNYEISDKGRKIKIPSSVSYGKIKILIEKAINCICCGACLSTCKYNALKIRNGKIEVNGNCVHCLECLRTNLLRGSCIVRNYSPKRKTLCAL